METSPGPPGPIGVCAADLRVGQDAQVDWYEAVAILGDEAVTLQVFCVRSMASGAAFHRAYPRATQQAFLEAHEGAFQYFAGVFTTVGLLRLSSP